MRAGIRTAVIENMIVSLPRALDTPVGERVVALSGVYRAHTALARALLGKPREIVLDEHSAMLDADSERAVGEAVVNAAKRLGLAA